MLTNKDLASKNIFQELAIDKPTTGCRIKILVGSAVGTREFVNLCGMASTPRLIKDIIKRKCLSNNNLG